MLLSSQYIYIYILFKKGDVKSIYRIYRIYCCRFSAMPIGSLAALTS